MASKNPTENILSISRPTLEQVVERSFEGIAIIGNEYRIEFVNDTVCRILGRSRDEIIGQDFRKFVHQDSSDLVMERYDKRQQGIPIIPLYEARVLHTETGPKDVRIQTSLLRSNGNEVKILACVLDITDEKRIQQALSERQRIYHSLVNTMNEGLGIIDDHGVVVYANIALCKMLDYTADELVGQHTTDILKGLDLDIVYSKIKDRIKGKSDRYESNLVHRSGRLIPVIVSATSLLSDSGEYTGSCVVLTDITNQKNVETHLHMTQKRALLYLDLMRHDIRNSLQEIQVSSELLRMSVKDPSQSEHIDTILQAISKSAKLIADSRTIEQLYEIPMEDRLLDEVLCESLRDASVVFDNIEISLSLHIREVHVKADEYLEVLLSDLLANAYVHNPREDKRIWVDLTARNNVYELSISDNGSGIPDDTKEVLFCSERRVEGIGLQLVQYIVEKYNGSIRVLNRIDNDSSQGTKVIISFPILP